MNLLTVVHGEGSEAGRGMLGVVDGDLLSVEVVVPVVLTKVDVVAEAFLEGAVGTFGLTVGLRMVSGGHGELGAELGPERAPEVSGESRIAVAEDGLGDTVVTNHFTNEEPSKFGSRNRGGGGDVVNHLKTVFPNIANFWMFWNVLWNALFRRAPGARCGLCVLQQFAARQPGLSQLKRSSCSRSSGLSIRLDSVPACH